MSSPRVALMVLAFLGQVLGPAAKELSSLQAPRNLTFMSKDFKLFLRWQPADDYSPEVFYTVKWRNPYSADWNTTHCVNISATSCDITCVNQRLNNQFRVQVEALERNGRSSAGVQSKCIDYDLLVELAPPVLQVREAEKVLVVNTTFTIPSCMKDFFQDLCYDLEFWEQGTKPMKLSGLTETENVVNINKTLFSNGHYCIHGQAYLPMKRKLSNFSKPVCGLLRKGEESWRLIFLLLLLLLIFPAGVAFIYFFCYKNTAAKFKMPQVLDFSNYKCSKRFLEFEEIKVDTFICERVSEIRRRSATQVSISEFLAAAKEEEEDDDDEDDDGGSPIPYTEFRFPKKDMSCKGVGMVLDSPSESDSSLSHGECSFSNVTLIPTELVMGRSTFDLQVSNRASFPGCSSSNDSLDFSLGYPATRRWEDTNGEIDFCVPLATLREGHDLSLPTETQFVAATDFPEGNWEDLEDTQMPLLRIQSHKDSCAILLEEQAEEDTEFESTSSSCGRRSTISSLEAVDGCTPVGNRNLELGIPGPTFHGYRPREHISYISRA